MPRADYRGARGANAGDEFHELWALREALELLVPDTPLAAVTVEGVQSVDAAATSASTWDGVDCAYYYGGETLASATAFRFDQVKYSSADPDKAWTVARLTASEKGAKRKRSILGRLGEAFVEIATQRPDLVAGDQVRIRLVSNQPVSDEVKHAVAERPSVSTRTNGGRALRAGSDARARLEVASGVPADLQLAFFAALDLSASGASSRIAAETQLLQQIAAWTRTDARPLLDGLMRTVRRLMMPEATGEFITRSDIIAWLGVSDEAALFPCPPAFAPLPAQRVSRAMATVVVNTMTSGAQRLCVHGSGGVGKTTVLAEVQSLLPAGSQMVSFDCYGGGRYLDAESPRHRPQEAFLQLTNELAARLRLPLLISQQATVAVFANRLRFAAEAIRALSTDALLVIAIDAADNAVLAAAQHAPPERSFVQELVRIGALPANVRLLISTRSSRREQLQLRSDFTLIEIPPFTEGETERAVRARWSEAPPEWVEEFHTLSAGNPRVQAYAFARADSTLSARSPERDGVGTVSGSLDQFDTRAVAPAEQAALALEALRPRGKDLDAVFAEQFAEAARKSGGGRDLVTIAQALMALPRPVPLRYLAAAAARSPDEVLEFCHDLSPGLRLADGAVNFADEDFETYVRAVAGSIATVVGRVAALLAADAASVPYAAQHLAGAFFAAGQRADVVALAQREDRLSVVPDPVVRREIQLQRLRLAMRVCRDAGKVGDALFTVVRGAAAVQTNHAIKDAFVQYPDLAARFAESSMSRTILQQASEFRRHGRLLLHRLAADAERGDHRSVRDGHRMLDAWFRARSAALEAERAAEREVAEGRRMTAADLQQDAGDWHIQDLDIAAEIEAVLRLHGASTAVSELMRWGPRTVVLSVLHTVSTRLAAAGDHVLLESLLLERRLAPWDVLVRVPLALTGLPFDAIKAEASVAQLWRRGLLRPAPRASDGADRLDVLFDAVIGACELCVAAGSRSDVIRSTLAVMGGRDQPTPYAGATSELDRRLRANALLARLEEVALTAERLVPPREPPSETDLAGGQPSATRAGGSARSREKRARDERDEETRDFIRPLVPLYDARARVLLEAESLRVPAAVPASNMVRAQLSDAVERLVRDGYRLRAPYGHHMRGRAAASLLLLLGCPGVDPSALWAFAGAVAVSPQTHFTELDAVQWTRASACAALHTRLIEEASARATAIQVAQLSAPDQLEALARLSQVICPISRDDARILFQAALETAQQVDPDFTHLVMLGAHMARYAAPVLDQVDRRRLAVAYAVVVEDAAIRLSGYDHFPWPSVVWGLAAWDMPCALAAVGRWHDCAVAGIDDTLPHLLQAGLEQARLTPEVALAMQPVVGVMARELPASIVAAVIQSEPPATPPNMARRRRIADALAEIALRGQDRDSNGDEVRAWAAIQELGVSVDDASWSQALRAAVAAQETEQDGESSDSLAADAANAFHDTGVESPEPNAFIALSDDARIRDSADPVRAEPVGQIPSDRQAAGSADDGVLTSTGGSWPWHEFDLASSDGLQRLLREYRQRTSDNPWIPDGKVLTAARARVTPAKRVAYLDALAGVSIREAASTDLIVGEICDATVEWGASLAVQDWLTRLIDRLPELLPALSRHLPYTSALRRLCRLMRLGPVAAAAPWAVAQSPAASGALIQPAGVGLQNDAAGRAQAMCGALLLGLERHVDQMSPAAIYAVVEEIVSSASADESALAANLTVSWLASRVASDHRAPWPLDDLPDAAPAGVARLLYALLGDVDTRMRWRAAHAMRTIASLGEDAVLAAAVAEYDHKVELLFADAGAPFYWQASRLWLMVALARAAHDSPASVAPFAAFLVRAGTQDEFPHLLVRWFAREGARAIAAVQSGVSTEAIVAMDRALGRDRPRVRVKAGREYGRLRNPQGMTPRFRFDPMDTVPYWFTPAAEVFANVDLAAFEAEATTWIVDRWGVGDIESAWDAQPRRRRLGDGMNSLHSHGSLPSTWRFDTHLEWHAMWCAMGSLLPAHTLVRASRNDLDRTLDHKLRREALASSPFWLADFRSPRPLDPWLQKSAAKRSARSGVVTESEMRVRAGLTTESEWITVASYVQLGERAYEDTTSVRTALVTPRHAQPLVRALQTVDDSHNFRLPDAKDEMEIRTVRRRLVGWLARNDERSGLDEHDPFRRESSGLPLLLPTRLAAQLGLRLVVNPFPCWVDDTGRTALRYEIWSGAGPRGRQSHDEGSDEGWRLQIRPDVLRRLLGLTGLDLIMEVGITLRTGVNEFRRVHEEEAPSEARLSRLYLLREGGELAAAHGSIGAWTTHRS